MSDESPRPPNYLVSLTISGRIHNLLDLRMLLGSDAEAIEKLEQDPIILLAWRRWGHRMAEHLVGDFALAIRDSERRETYLARSPTGTRPLYFRIDGPRLTHAFSVPALNRECSYPLTPDLDWIARFLVGMSKHVRATGYREIFKLPPGHCLLFDAAGRVEERTFHQWRDDPPAASSRSDRWVEEYRTVLEEAVRCRMDVGGPIASENSGGLDSATVTACLARLLGNSRDRLHSFSFVSSELEPALISSTNRASGIVNTFVVSSIPRQDDPDGAVLKALEIFGLPRQQTDATGAGLFLE